MKKFVLMHFGFENPTPDIMDAWNTWFESIADKTVENVGFSGGREISKSGTKELAWKKDSITGYSVIEAESLEAAVKLAQTNPFVESIRIYEVRSMQSFDRSASLKKKLPLLFLFENRFPFQRFVQFQPLGCIGSIPVLAVPDSVSAGFAFGIDEFIRSGIRQEADRGLVTG